MCMAGMTTFPDKPTPMFGLTLQSGAPRQETSNSVAPTPFTSQPSGGTPSYADMQQQPQDLQATAPRPTTGRFSFNNGNFRIGESTMNSSDTGLNI